MHQEQAEEINVYKVCARETEEQRTVEDSTG